MSTQPTTPIRIAFCITDLDPGGAERCLTELVARLDRARFEPVVYCLGPRPAGKQSLADRIEQSGSAVHFFGARRATELSRVLREVSRQMKLDSPRIVQSFLFHANVVGTLAARWAGVPHRLTGIRVAEHRRRGHLLMARWTNRWVVRHVCVSQSVKEFSRTHSGLPEDKLVVIPNGVDVQRFANAQPATVAALGLSPSTRAITFVGRLDEQKGIAWLLRLMPQIFAAWPGHDLLLVGDGKERQRLEELAQRLKIAERVHFLGFRPDVPEILAASELLVLPSRWEGMPNVVLEAMAAGKPVVACDVEGVAEALGPDRAAQVVAAEEPAAFVTAIEAILRCPDAARELGMQNRQRAEQHFDLRLMVNAYERLYLSLIAGTS